MTDQESTQDIPSTQRRGFLKNLGAGAGLLAAGAVAVGAGEMDVAAQEIIEWDHEVDILVCGAGVGGMSAAIKAAEGGAKTLVLEVSVITGGNSTFAGSLHTSRQYTWEDYNRFTQGRHDQKLAKVFIETCWDEWVPWLLERGAELQPRRDTGFGGHSYGGSGNRKFFGSLEDAYTKLGGEIQLKTRVRKLITNDQGEVIGVKAQRWVGSPLEADQAWVKIKAKKTIMAIGGWVTDGERKARYLGLDADTSRHLCGPFSNGEGIDICQEVGAGLGKRGWSGFAGGLVAMTETPQNNADPEYMMRMLENAPPEDWGSYYTVGRRYGPWIDYQISPWEGGGTAAAILVNKTGVRFVDESSGVFSNYSLREQAVAKQPGGYAWVIADQKIYDAYPSSKAQLDAIINEGGQMGNHGNVIIAETIDELADRLAAVGVYKGQFLKTISEYNAAVDAGAQEDLPISHSTERGSGGYAIRTGPFYAYPVTPAPYYCYGGVRFNEHSQALDPYGKPVPNLYTPPPLGGGFMAEVYMGATASAGTFGYLAAKHALNHLI